MTSYRGNEAIDWFGFSQLWSQTVGYAVTTNRIDSLNRRKTLSKSLASARLLFCGKGDGVKMRVYIWMEGTDADCVNNAAAEDPATYNVNVKLAGISAE